MRKNLDRRNFLKLSVPSLAATPFFSELLGNRIALPVAASINSSTGLPKTLGARNPQAQRVARLVAKPAPVDLELNRTVVLVVDMQNDFCSARGAMDREGADLSIVRRTIPATRSALAAARKADMRIVYLKMGFQPDLSDVGTRDSRNWINNRDVGTSVTSPNGAPSRILIRETWNTEIIPELKPAPADTIIYKNRFSGFYQTDLDAILRRWETRFLVVAGCTTSVCVESTIRDAMFRDYSPVLLADCTAEPEGFALQRSNYQASLFLI